MKKSLLKLAAAALLAWPAASQAAFHFFDPTDTANVPHVLSGTGIYISMGSKATDTALKYYEVNAPLWSDNAQKSRWIILKPGKHITYVDSTDYFDYPDSTTFVKLFRHDTVEGDTTSRIYWETRLLVNHKVDGHDSWYGFSYKWNHAATEAYLVPPDGLDTLLYYYPKGLAQPSLYRKWKYPEREYGGCWKCHRHDYDPTPGVPLTRGVLGFFPSQLKRPLTGGGNQVASLFSQGVFTGAVPADSILAKRWRGVSEAIPGGLSAADRFKVIDTMARSYLGANCSGCHGDRAAKNGVDCPAELNMDFYNFRPRVEVGAVARSSGGLDFYDSTDISGRYRFILSIVKAGLDTSAGKPWNMAAPPDQNVLFIRHGYPSYSLGLFRQTAKSPTWYDSASVRNSMVLRGTYVANQWLFANPWGSQAWRAAISAHGGGTVDSLLEDAGAFDASSAMPPLATFQVDTTAFKILGEWVKTYQTLYVVDSSHVIPVRGKIAAPSASVPFVQNRVLILPSNWTGKVRMTSISGRVYGLSAVGKNRYALPAIAPSGVYFFRVGARSFRTLVLQN